MESVFQSARRRIPVWGLLFAMLLSFYAERTVSAAGAVRSTLFSETETIALGLTRSWFNQVTMDVGRDRITHVTLQDDTLFITTNGGRLHVIDGKTGATLWSRIIGPPEYELLAPGVNSRVVVVICGVNIHVFDRFNGKRLLEFPVNGPPGAGPQVSERYMYVPILTRKMYAYPLKRLSEKDPNLKLSFESLDDLRRNKELSEEIARKIQNLEEDKRIEQYQFAAIEARDLQTCPSLGHPIVQPVLASQSLVEDYCGWVTDKGWMMIGRTQFSKDERALKLMYRVSLAPEVLFTDRQHLNHVNVDYRNEMNYRPTYIPKDKTERNLQKGEAAKGGLILVGAGTGFVFAVNDLSGSVQWKFAAGVGVIDPIGVADDRCYVPTYSGSFFCLDMKDGQEVWRAENIRQYVSSSKDRIYVLDRFGNLTALSKTDGRVLASMPVDVGAGLVFNVESDQIYIVGPDGLVQCLHDIGQKEPIRYRETSFEIADRLWKEYEAYKKGLVDRENKGGKTQNDAADSATAPAVPAADSAADSNKNNPLGGQAAEKSAPEKSAAEPESAIDAGEKEENNPFE